MKIAEIIYADGTKKEIIADGIVGINLTTSPEAMPETIAVQGEIPVPEMVVPTEIISTEGVIIDNTNMTETVSEPIEEAITETAEAPVEEVPAEEPTAVVEEEPSIMDSIVGMATSETVSTEPVEGESNTTTESVVEETPVAEAPVEEEPKKEEPSTDFVGA